VLGPAANLLKVGKSAKIAHGNPLEVLDDAGHPLLRRIDRGRDLRVDTRVVPFDGLL
jgi:hypothetical protein